MNPEIEKRPGEIQIALQNLHNMVEELEMTFANLSDRLSPVLTSEDNVKGVSNGSEVNPAHPVPMVNSIDSASHRLRTVLQSMCRVHNRLEI